MELPRNKCSTSNFIPWLIDNKCNHLEHQLSAAERDKLLINEAKEEAMFWTNGNDRGHQRIKSHFYESYGNIWYFHDCFCTKFIKMNRKHD